jgi:hypothetical protein
MLFIGQNVYLFDLTIFYIYQGENIAMSEMSGAKTVKTALSF